AADECIRPARGQDRRQHCGRHGVRQPRPRRPADLVPHRGARRLWPLRRRLLVRPAATMTAIILVVLVAAYLAMLALLYATQRRIVFNPDITGADLVASGLAEQMTEVAIEPEPGLKLSSWWAPAVRPDRRVIVYFHGNAGHHGGRADRIPDYLAAGYGLLLV